MALAKSIKEEMALEKFSNVMADLNLDKGTMMRFLRARNLDLGHAETMLRAYVHWTKTNPYEPALLGWKPPKDFTFQFEAYYCGLDLEGRSVFYIQFDKWMPSRPLFEVYEAFDMLVFSYRAFQLIYEQVILPCKHQQVVAILNNEGIGFTKIFHEIHQWTGVQTLIEVCQQYEANYPETLHKAFFINTAKAFLYGFSMIKPFVSKGTLSKISMYGSDEEEWGSALQKALPSSAIPERFGGTARMVNVYDRLFKYGNSNNNNNKGESSSIICPENNNNNVKVN